VSAFIFVLLLGSLLTYYQITGYIPIIGGFPSFNISAQQDDNGEIEILIYQKGTYSVSLIEVTIQDKIVYYLGECTYKKSKIIQKLDRKMLSKIDLKNIGEIKVRLRFEYDQWFLPNTQRKEFFINLENNNQ